MLLLPRQKFYSKMILRKAVISEPPVIWEIIQQVIEQRRRDGSNQWQNGYPNEQTINDDIAIRLCALA